MSNSSASILSSKKDAEVPGSFKILRAHVFMSFILSEFSGRMIIPSLRLSMNWRCPLSIFLFSAFEIKKLPIKH